MTQNEIAESVGGLKWSMDLPTRPGWYFLRDKIMTSNIVHVVKVLQLEGRTVSHVMWSYGKTQPLWHFKQSEFAGPIAEPE